MQWHSYGNNLGHAFMSPSGYHWLNYDSEKIKGVYLNNKRKEEGTQLHEFASNAINHRIKLAPLKRGLNQFVNDCIGYKLRSEQTLYYSDNCFGTVDAIGFKNNHLMVFDLKTGVTKASFKQLDVYVALFCLEYSVSPFDIKITQRIYQGSGFEEVFPEPEYIHEVMNKIVDLDKELEAFKSTLVK